MTLSDILGNDPNPDIYLLVQVESTSRLVSGPNPLLESQWKPSGEDDYWYRVDPADPDQQTDRHIHIGKKKHIKTKNKQVSWNTSAKRHDKKTFDDNFTGIEKARKIARRVLGLPDDASLEEKILLLPTADIEGENADEPRPLVGFTLKEQHAPE
jgi:hypothetical protein